jgi:tocopherol O-methyltransferase
MIQSTLCIQPEDVAGHYDDLDVYYRYLWGEHVHHGLWMTGTETVQQAVEQLITYVSDALPVYAGQQVIDVGCGYGGASRYLAQQRQWRMVGLTLSAVQFNYATARTAKDDNPRFLLQDWTANDFDSETFDGLLSIECLAHVADKPRYFEEIFRVLKPRARAAVTAWLSAEQLSGVAQRWLLESICREGRLPSMGTAADYRQLAERAGLRIVSYAELTQHVQRTWRLCLGRMVRMLTFSPLGWQFLIKGKSRHAIFAFTVAKILLAYACGAMSYGFFVLEKPASNV